MFQGSKPILGNPFDLVWTAMDTPGRTTDRQKGFKIVQIRLKQPIPQKHTGHPNLDNFKAFLTIRGPYRSIHGCSNQVKWVTKDRFWTPKHAHNPFIAPVQVVGVWANPSYGQKSIWHRVAKNLSPPRKMVKMASKSCRGYFRTFLRLLADDLFFFRFFTILRGFCLLAPPQAKTLSFQYWKNPFLALFREIWKQNSKNHYFPKNILFS